jgi:glycerol dehydrogenase
MQKVFSFPSKYIQGRDSLSKLGVELERQGLKGKALLIFSKHSEKVASQKVMLSLKHSNFEFDLERFQGEAFEKEIEHFSEIVSKNRSDFIIAIGGGKVIDFVRVLAHKFHKDYVVCPTIASSNTACLNSSIIYSEKGQAEEVLKHLSFPKLVLVDLDIIAKSPKRYFISGLGDAIASFYEARVCKENYRLNLEEKLPNELGFLVAKLAREILLKEADQALRAVEQQTVTQALEKCVEAIFLMSSLSIYNCGVAAAHSIHNGLTTLSPTKDFYHGEIVAFSVLAELVMEGRPSREIEQLCNFYRLVGLPITLEQIGVSKTNEEYLMPAAERATRRDESIHNEPFQVTSNMVLDAIRVADQIGKRVIEKSYLSFDAWSRAA